MKNKVLLISLAVVLAMSLAAMGAQCLPPSDTIVVGMSRSVTGSLATVHSSQFGAIYPIYFDYVNNVLGGVNIGSSYFDVVADIRNDSSINTTLIANTNTLIADIQAGDVDFLFGAAWTDFINDQAPIANAANVTLITFEGGASYLKDNPTKLPSWPYVFMHQSYSAWYQLPVLAPLLVDAGGYDDGDGDGADTAYICWQNDSYGQDYLAAAQAYFEDPLNENGDIDIVGNSSVQVPITTEWAEDLIVAINNTSPRPDVVCLFCYPEGVCALTDAAIRLDCNFDAWVTGVGGNFGWFGTGPPIGANAAEGVICFATANNKTSSAMEDLYNNKLAGLGFEDLDFWGHPLYWAALQIWQDAVEAVGQGGGGMFVIDQTAFKNQLASYCDVGSGVATVLGTTWYHMFGANATGGGILDYYCHTGEIGQWQDGYVEIVGYTNITDDLPNYVVTANFTYPKPDWPPP